MTFVLRTNLSPVAPILAKELHLTDFELGLLLSGFLWSYTVLQPVAGRITDRIAAKLSMLFGVAATSILTILSGFANSFLVLFPLRIALGVTQAPNFVSGAKVTSSGWFTKDTEPELHPYGLQGADWGLFWLFLSRRGWGPYTVGNGPSSVRVYLASYGALHG